MATRSGLETLSVPAGKKKNGKQMYLAFLMLPETKGGWHRVTCNDATDGQNKPLVPDPTRKLSDVDARLLAEFTSAFSATGIDLAAAEAWNKGKGFLSLEEVVPTPRPLAPSPPHRPPLQPRVE